MAGPSALMEKFALICAIQAKFKANCDSTNDRKKGINHKSNL